MKFYLFILLLTFVFINQSIGQVPSSREDNKSELPKISKESLQVITDVELYPNPANEYLNIKLKNSNLKNVQFEIYNVIGNKLEIEFDAVNSENYKISVKDFSSGYYLLIVKDPISRYNKAFKFRKL
jgi:hypothetical protein